MMTCTTVQDFDHDRYHSLVITWSCKRRGQFKVAGEGFRSGANEGELRSMIFMQ